MADPLGLESGFVRLAEYDTRWPALFAAEQQRIRDQSGTLTLSLEHIGGTSIPGMCAKPVLDIAVGRPRDTPVQDYIAALTRAGYEHRGEQGLPGREFFRRGQPRAYHVHLVEEGGPLWRDYLAFRDYLRAHAEAVHRFAEAKRGLAARFSRDREGYTNAKSSHVQGILRLAGARITLDVLRGSFAICRWPPEASLPPSVTAGAFFSVTRTHAELSAVCDIAAVPPGVKTEGPWSILAVRGPLDFNLTGVLAGLTAPLAAAGVSVFAVSTFDTDYVLVRNDDLDRAIRALRGAGHDVSTGE